MSPRQPPLVRCRCGRLHRSWAKDKVCSKCVREDFGPAPKRKGDDWDKLIEAGF